MTPHAGHGSARPAPPASAAGRQAECPAASGGAAAAAMRAAQGISPAAVQLPVCSGQAAAARPCWHLQPALPAAARGNDRARSEKRTAGGSGRPMRHQKHLYRTLRPPAAAAGTAAAGPPSRHAAWLPPTCPGLHAQLAAGLVARWAALLLGEGLAPAGWVQYQFIHATNLLALALVPWYGRAAPGSELAAGTARRT